MGYVINKFHFDRLSKLMENTGGQMIYGGKKDAKINYIQPTIILNPSDDSLLMNEEIFGPILPIKVYKNIDEVISYVNARPKPLAVYYFGQPHHEDSNKLKD